MEGDRDGLMLEVEQVDDGGGGCLQGRVHGHTVVSYRPGPVSHNPRLAGV